MVISRIRVEAPNNTAEQKLSPCSDAAQVHRLDELQGPVLGAIRLQRVEEGVKREGRGHAHAGDNRVQSEGTGEESKP